MVVIIGDSKKVNYTGKHVQGWHYLIIFILCVEISWLSGEGEFLCRKHKLMSNLETFKKSPGCFL